LLLYYFFVTLVLLTYSASTALWRFINFVLLLLLLLVQHTVFSILTSIFLLTKWL